MTRSPAGKTLVAASFRDLDSRLRVRTASQLESVLQARLHFLALWALWLWTAFLLLVGVTFWRAVAAHPERVFTRPPLLGFVPLVLASFFAVARLTRPAASPGLARLRAIEWLLFTPGSLWMSALWAIQLRTTVVATRPDSELALGSATFWIVAMFGYAVLIPNHWRRSAKALGLFTALAFIPDLLFVLPASTSPAIAAYYMAIKALILFSGASLAAYGAYRIEALEADAQIAREYGQYTLHERLGEGGMAEVYKASHRLLRRPCVVKLIKPDLADAADILERFEREVQATSTLTHPNTVHVYDYGRADDGTFYYVMEYLPGESLEQLVERDGPLTPSRVVHFLSQVCESLHEAHRLGLVHRDIKPGNVIVCERGGVPDVVKVVDFGLVAPFAAPKDLPRVTLAGMLVGTPAFMSPEQINGEDVGPASDIYSIGALGWYLLRGTPLFGDRGGMQIFVAHLTESPPPLATPDCVVPPALESALRRCLAKSPEERFPDTLALRDELRASVEDPRRYVSALDRDHSRL